VLLVPSIVAEPETVLPLGAVRADVGIFSVPASVPPESVSVNGAFRFPEVSALVRESVEEKLPLLDPSEPVPVAVILVPAKDPDAVTVSVVLVVAACAAAPRHSASARLPIVRII